MTWNHAVTYYAQNMDKLPEEEAMIFDYLLRAEPGERIHQDHLAMEFRTLGSYSRYEAPAYQSTLRKIRLLIRNLRVDYGIPILSDRAGYWLPQNMFEVQDWVDLTAKKAKATARAWFETYKAVRDSTGARAPFLDKQMELFNTTDL